MVETSSTLTEFFKQTPADSYFTRPVLAKDLFWKFQSTRLLTVLGGPGVGKSSLIEKELKPLLLELKEGEKQSDWRIATAYAHRNPIGNLAEAIFSVIDNNETEDVERIDRMLRSGSNGLVRVYNEIIAPQQPQNSNQRLLLVLDQLEDVFRFKKLEAPLQESDELEDVLFFNLLLHAVQEKDKFGIHFLLVTDTQYLDSFNQYRGISDVIAGNRFNIPPVTYRDVVNQLPTIGKSSMELMLLKDIQALFKNEDPYAVPKIHLGLQLLKEAYEGRKEDPEVENKLLEFYEDEMGTLQGVMNFYADRHIQDFDASQLLLCERLFKAVAVYSAAEDGLTLRRPAIGQELNSIFTRENRLNLGIDNPQNREKQPFDNSTLKSLVDHFNSGPVKMFNKINHGDWNTLDGEILKGTIIDLANTGLFNNWWEFRDWMLEEARNVGSYLKLVDDSLFYYIESNTPKVEEETNSENSGTENKTPSKESAALAGPTLQSIDGSREAVVNHFKKRGKISPLLKIKPARKSSALGKVTEFVVKRSRWLTRFLSKEYSRLLVQNKMSKDLEDKGLYSSGLLESASESWGETQPNADWAAQYYPLDFQVIGEENATIDKEILKKVEKEHSSTFRMAFDFLQASIQQKKKQESLAIDLQKAETKFWRRVTVLFLGLIIVAGIAAAWAWIEKNEVTRTRQTIQLHSYLDLLSQTQIIFDDPRDPRKKNSETINHLKDSIVLTGSDKFLTRDDVLEMLGRNYFLDLPDASITGMTAGFRELYTDVSIEGINSIWSLHEVLKTTINSSDSIKARIDSLHGIIAQITPERYSSADAPESFFQVPYLYQAIQEHIDTIDRKDYLKQTNSLVSCFASNPKAKRQFAVGDVSGHVVVYYSTEIELDKPLNIPGPQKAITQMHYSPDGENLYVSTENGGLHRYEKMLGLPGLPFPEPDEVFRASDPIEYISDGPFSNQLVAVTLSDIYLLGPDGAGNMKEVDRISFAGALPLLRGFAAKDGQRIFLGGRNRTLVYRINASGGFEQEPQVINHSGITITAIGIKEGSDSLNPEYSLALGSEDGMVWITDYDRFLRLGERNLTRENGIEYHQAAVTGLLFNPELPQLASSSLDGSIRLWNLRFIKDNSSIMVTEDRVHGFDNVRLEDQKQGVWNICYINEDELVATENLNVKIWYTNISALKEALLTESEDIHDRY